MDAIFWGLLGLLAGVVAGAAGALLYLRPAVVGRISLRRLADRPGPGGSDGDIAAERIDAEREQTERTRQIESLMGYAPKVGIKPGD